MDEDSPIEKALRLPAGGRFRRCALKLRPWDYVREAVTGSGALTLGDESSFNAALVDACVRQGIEVVAVDSEHRSELAAGIDTPLQWIFDPASSTVFVVVVLILIETLLGFLLAVLILCSKM